jgi:hypothetical protein
MQLVKKLRMPRMILCAAWLLSFMLLTFKTVPVSGDGIYYYAYLRSMVIDRDLDFQNDLEFFHDRNIHVARQLDSGVLTPASRTPNLFSIGPAFLWMPVYVVAHGLAYFLAPYTGQIADGFSSIELFAPSLATALYGLVGLALAYYFLGRVVPRASPLATASLIAAIFFGTNLFYYLTFEASMSHGLGFFAVNLLLVLWLKWRHAPFNKKTVWQWLLIGGVIGLAGLVRWQLLAVAIVIPGLDLLIRAAKNLSRHQARQALQHLGRLALATLGALIVFSAQLIAWKSIYGSYLVVPQGTGFFNLASPHFLEVLFSSRHGLFTWTPLALLAVAGLILALFKKFRSSIAPFVLYALLILLVQTYINGTALEWWGGEAFGPRRFTDISIIFMLGLTVLTSITTTLKKIWHWIFWTLIAVCIIVNLLFMQIYRHGLIPRDQPLRFSTVVDATQQLY